ncbi:PilW family protein [Tepidibacter hydrothermalis]|uniref:Prepilin-type N-terminal cleavage/methylation domain-containing protein n=1 Tax=Tepidibacter hydrothermalis TaxID=3036126 RepID=A0ABY8EDN2_9FIRM|nr:prepilin-type N-terminal cleavage/methylation domain-containing protein [Tepidibacter hydrothermalis]WFD11047.1 prepilin-type N-terminal cleavage/methylation domain-containing protein [Tepidibacter hydrothermalis]
MKYILKNKKGFTLIELLIVLAITSIVIGAINLFFLSNYKTFFRADDQITVQHQVQKAINEIVDRVRETEKVLQDPVDKPSEYIIEFKTDLTIKYDKTNKIISYKKGTESEVELAENIEKFEIRPIPSESDYIDCKGIEIKIKAKKNGSEVEIIDEVYFRNFKK